MQVANDVASANELALTTPPLPESCRAASSARIASRALWSVVSLAESAAFVAYEASSIDEGLGGETQQGICYLDVHLQWRVQPVHRGEQGGQPGVRLAEEGGVQGCCGDCAQKGRRYLDGAYAVRALASALEACSPRRPAQRR